MLVSNMLNAKAYLVYAAVLPQFINVSVPVLPQLALLTATYVAVATVIHSGIALLAGSLNAFFASREKFRLMSRLFAVLLAAVAVWFFYATGAKS